MGLHIHDEVLTHVDKKRLYKYIDYKGLTHNHRKGLFTHNKILTHIDKKFLYIHETVKTHNDTKGLC